MTAPVDDHDGLRRAALALHALETADRDWLLEQLPAHGREALSRLLIELRDLGIPRDAQVIRVALSEAPAAAAITQREAVSLCRTLVEESPALQGLMLATLGDAERCAVLAHWPHEVHGRPDPIVEPTGTSAFRAALLQSWREAASAAREWA